MAILDRFGDIIRANINALIDSMEDPEKMIDQYLRDMLEDLAEVRRSTAGVMAEEARTQRLADENRAESGKYAAYAKKALAAGSEGDARVFIAKKLELDKSGAALASACALARENAAKMRRMHDKLAGDIEILKSRRETIKAKMAVAKTQEALNRATASIKGNRGVGSAFDRMEDKADRMLDEANAMSELASAPVDEAEALERKYGAMSDSSVDDELNRMKAELGM